MNISAIDMRLAHEVIFFLIGKTQSRSSQSRWEERNCKLELSTWENIIGIHINVKNVRGRKYTQSALTVSLMPVGRYQKKIEIPPPRAG